MFGEVTLRKHLILSLVNLVDESLTEEQKSSTRLMKVVLSKLPKQVEGAGDNKPDFTVNGATVHLLLRSIMAPGFQFVDDFNFKDFQSALRAWFKNFLPRSEDFEIESAFVWALIDEIRARVEYPGEVVQMTMEHLEKTLLPPRSGASSVTLESTFLICLITCLYDSLADSLI